MTNDIWVYRDGRRRERGDRVRAELARGIERLSGASGEARRRYAIDALVIAGEVEASLADSGRSACTELTDALAHAALGHAREPIPVLAALPDTLTLSPPEGFSYYALHPAAYAEASRVIEARDVLVVGVRSIGTTLSAIVRADLLARGIRAERTTVRPTGDPFDRRLESVPRVREGTTVLVVDEGPGLSGSTFLATAEAFTRAGAREVVLMTSCEPDLDRLRAPSARERWRVFRTIVAPAKLPFAGRDLSGGAWRELHGCWPSSFITAERRKFLSDDGWLFKFEGLGSASARARERADVLAREGIAPDATDAGDGWLAYRWQGRPLDATTDIVDAIARACAVRKALFATSDATDLEPVIEKNARVLLGCTAPRLELRHPVIADGRMAPHEWLRLPDGSIRKTDAISHGDDHFFPGPTDIAWDLAGAIVEWGLDPARLLDAYRRESGDDAGPRIRAWTFAYAICRAAFLDFAKGALRGTAEEPRLARDFDRALSAAKQCYELGGASVGGMLGECPRAGASGDPTELAIRERERT
jgi:hypothetical protein